MRPIIANQSGLKRIVRDPFGNYVIQRLLVSLPYDSRQELHNALKEYFETLQEQNV